MKNFLRGFIVLICVISGYFLGLHYELTYFQGPILGLLAGAFVIVFEFLLIRVSIGRLAGGIVGMFLGVLIATVLVLPLKTIFISVDIKFFFIINALFGYIGLLIGFTRGENLTIGSLLDKFRGQHVAENIKIIDTSTIIDGRIADICDTGFVDGIFIVPQFILQELQHIADSADSIKRSRGRRGLDVLNRIQKISGINVRIVDENFPNIKEVDSKLVAIAKVMNGKIITNDFNLNKVAQLQNVSVLNVNELANALKPVVLPGEMMKVFVMKEGKEATQGIAYMDDGTMVVIENSRKLIGKNISVIVTSVLQTTAGRMIFAKRSDEE